MIPRQFNRLSLLLIAFLFVCSFTYSSAQQNAESLVFHAYAKPEVLNQAFAQIAAEIRNQYRVSVEKRNLSGKEKWRKLRLKLDLPKEKGRPKLHVRIRDGYYQ